MNFFGHIHMAALASHDTALAFGAMLPDFAGMVRARIQHVHNPSVAAGVSLHHATDDAFHGSGPFVALCVEAVEDLTAAGLEQGHARAVAHIATEMLLDASLVSEPASGDLYLGAMERSAEYLGEVAVHAHHDALKALVARVATYGLPIGYRDDEFVRDRVVGALASRPRLRLESAEAEAVLPWVSQHRPKVYAQKHALIDAVSSKLAQLNEHAK